jgi:hypothetical protein
MDGIGDRVRDFVRRGLWLGGMVHGMGKAARVRAVCTVPDYFGHSGFILGVAIGGITGCGIHPRSLVLIANTHFESNCCRRAAVWYHRPVWEFLQAGLR